jgi:hypothetical protein
LGREEQAHPADDGERRGHGGRTVDVKNKSTKINYNSLKTGDTVNYNANENKQILSFGIPFLTPVRERKAP